MRMETVEDIEKWVTIFNDPERVNFLLQEYGYCTNCQCIMPCDISACSEGVDVYCLRCNRSSSGWESSTWYLTEMNVPACMQEELRQLHSRENQMAIFRLRLESHLKRLRAEEKNVRAKVRKTAAALSNINALGHVVYYTITFRRNQDNLVTFLQLSCAGG